MTVTFILGGLQAISMLSNSFLQGSRSYLLRISVFLFQILPTQDPCVSVPDLTYSGSRCFCPGNGMG